MIARRRLDDPVFDVDLYPADDIDLPLRLGLKGKLANLPEPLYRIRSHPRSTTQAKIRAMEKKTFEVRRKGRSRVRLPRQSTSAWNAAQWATMYVMPGTFRFWLLTGCGRASEQASRMATYRCICPAQAEVVSGMYAGSERNERLERTSPEPAPERDNVMSSP